MSQRQPRIKLTLLMLVWAMGLVVACDTGRAAATPAPAAGVAAARPAVVSDAIAANPVRISEIMYNPPDGDGVDGSDLEFLEVVNAGNMPVDLGNAFFRDGIAYTFPADITLDVGAHWVLASNASAFAARYGFTPDGTYTGQLDNSGEQLTLAAANGAVLATVSYDVMPPWPLTPDGLGFALVPVDGQVEPDDGSQWRSSRNMGGSPGMPDPDPTVPAIHITEILAHTDPPQIDTVELFNPTDGTVDLSGWYLSDDFSEPAKFQFGAGTRMPAGSYLLVTADTLGFALSEMGEEIALFSATADGAFTGYDHSVVFGASPNGVSFGRHTTSTGAVHYPLQAELTLGEANGAPLVGPVVISAINFRPTDTRDAYVELTNISRETIPLFDPEHVENRWRLDGVGGYALPLGIYLNADATALIVGDAPDAFRSRHKIPDDVQIFGPFDGSLARDGERLALLRPERPNADDGLVPYITVDTVEYGVDGPWPAPQDDRPLARRNLTAYGDDPANWTQRLPARVFLPWLAQRVTP